MEPLDPGDVRRVLAENRFGVLALAKEGAAYAIPLFYAYDGSAVYGHAHPGLKDEYLQATREACLVVSRAESEDVWESVLVFGPVTQALAEEERARAMDALLSIPLPPEMGRSGSGEPLRTSRSLRIWKLTPWRATGRRSMRPPVAERDVGAA